MPHLILVKHALPEIIPRHRRPSNGICQRSVVPNVRCWLTNWPSMPQPLLVASPEPKALETAHLVAQQMHASVRVMDGLAGA